MTRTRFTLPGALVALVLAITGLVATSAPADAATCSTGYLWTTHQNAFKSDGSTKVVIDAPAGTRFCPPSRPAWNDNDGPKAWGGWALNSTSTRWITATRIQPRGAGSGSDSAAAWRMVNDMAERHNVRVQFATHDNKGRGGYLRASTWMITGTYSASTWTGGKRGSGIIRLGVGANRLGTPTNDAAFRANLKKVFFHELGHVKIERHCGTHTPRMAADRVEHVTDAYSTVYLGMSSANYGYTAKDVWRAKQIHAGNCG